MVTLLSWLDDHQAPWLLLVVVLLVQTGGLASSTHLFIRRTGDCQLMFLCHCHCDDLQCYR